jgi:hypothetical protein
MPGLRGLEPANVISKILLQLARERSQVPKCSGDPRRICPTFQRLSQNDVCEFESSQPRQTVHPLWTWTAISGLSTELGRVTPIAVAPNTRNCGHLADHRTARRDPR